MIFLHREPGPSLNGCVESLIYFRGYDPEHRVERIVPDGSVNLVFELDGRVRHVVDNSTHEPVSSHLGAWLSGLHVNHFSITALEDSEMLAVRFQPGGAYPFVRRSLAELTEQVQPAEDWFGDDVLGLRRNLLATESGEEKLALTERWLVDRFESESLPPAGIGRAIRRIQSEPLVSSLKGLAEEAGYSQKQLIHHFRRHVGVPPKVFQRILRFCQVLPQLQAKETVNWAQLALDCGYYDQAHLIRDFKTFSGYRPQGYVEEGHDRLNFFPVD